MPFTLTMPKLSPTMEEGQIAKWHKQPGDFVAAGDLLMEVATDKATVEHNALDEGYLRKIVVDEGGMAIVNQAIAVFTEEADESIEGYEPEGIAASTEVTEVNEEAVAEVTAGAAPAVSNAPATGGGLAQPAFEPLPPLENYEFDLPRGSQAERLRSSPLARKLAQEKGLDISSVKGTGPGGRVVAKDLERAQPDAAASFGRRSVPTELPGSFEEEPLTPMRKAIGKRLQESKTFIPHFYVTQTIDAQPMVDMRGQLKDWEIKVSFNDFIVRACALALREHPVINSGFNTVNNSITHYKTIDVCVAVSIDGGLITPIIRHTDFKNLGEISAEVKNLAKRARDGKLEPHEYQGGSFTVSNLGMYGISDFVAVINPPQGAILAVGGLEEKPVVKDGQVVPGKTMSMTLSSDHRVIDGAAAAEFLRTVKRYLENPAGLLL